VAELRSNGEKFELAKKTLVEEIRSKDNTFEDVIKEKDAFI